MCPKNLKLSHAEGDDADCRGKYEAVNGDDRVCHWAVRLYRNGDQDEVEKPLDAILVG